MVRRHAHMSVKHLQPFAEQLTFSPQTDMSGEAQKSADGGCAIIASLIFKLATGERRLRATYPLHADRRAERLRIPCCRGARWRGRPSNPSVWPSNRSHRYRRSHARCHRRVGACAPLEGVRSVALRHHLLRAPATSGIRPRKCFYGKTLCRRGTSPNCRAAHGEEPAAANDLNTRIATLHAHFPDG